MVVVGEHIAARLANACGTRGTLLTHAGQDRHDRAPREMLGRAVQRDVNRGPYAVNARTFVELDAAGGGEPQVVVARATSSVSATRQSPELVSRTLSWLAPSSRSARERVKPAGKC